MTAFFAVLAVIACLLAPATGAVCPSLDGSTKTTTNCDCGKFSATGNAQPLYCPADRYCFFGGLTTDVATCTIAPDCTKKDGTGAAGAGGCTCGFQDMSDDGGIKAGVGNICLEGQFCQETNVPATTTFCLAKKRCSDVTGATATTEDCSCFAMAGATPTALELAPAKISICKANEFCTGSATDGGLLGGTSVTFPYCSTKQTKTTGGYQGLCLDRTGLTVNTMECWCDDALTTRCAANQFCNKLDINGKYCHTNKVCDCTGNKCKMMGFTLASAGPPNNSPASIATQCDCGVETCPVVGGGTASYCLLGWYEPKIGYGKCVLSTDTPYLKQCTNIVGHLATFAPCECVAADFKDNLNSGVQMYKAQTTACAKGEFCDFHTVVSADSYGRNEEVPKCHSNPVCTDSSGATPWAAGSSANMPSDTRHPITNAAPNTDSFQIGNTCHCKGSWPLDGEPGTCQKGEYCYPDGKCRNAPKCIVDRQRQECICFPDSWPGAKAKYNVATCSAGSGGVVGKSHCLKQWSWTGKQETGSVGVNSAAGTPTLNMYCATYKKCTIDNGLTVSTAIPNVNKGNNIGTTNPTGPLNMCTCGSSGSGNSTGAEVNCKVGQWCVNPNDYIAGTQGRSAKNVKLADLNVAAGTTSSPNTDVSGGDNGYGATSYEPLCLDLAPCSSGAGFAILNLNDDKNCACGTATCNGNQYCTWRENKCADVPNCLNTLDTAPTQRSCSCGTSICKHGQFCTLATSKCNDWYDHPTQAAPGLAAVLWIPLASLAAVAAQLA